MYSIALRETEAQSLLMGLGRTIIRLKTTIINKSQFPQVISDYEVLK